jgi:MoxR-like ATPase
VKAVERPIVVITSNNEKELPDAFLRRCFFHYIRFPDRETMQAIIDVHFPASSSCWSRRRSISFTRCARCRG